MYAITFDMVISDLEKYYGKPYNNAYYEISNILQEFGFFRTQGSVYLNNNSDMANLMEAIQTLSEVEWFANSVRDIRGFRVEDWSNFTKLVKRKATN
ncbi:virulence-associated protein [Riemerella anatipestifer]|nr:virulence-associated protein [Riemerella anatipestifer]AAD33094.1 virulence-associated protein [Riemerella anatipestifer]MBT0552608.1 virulence protein [Riemerella anatipestifer]MBT0554908.1 virulence protein [Riemerella anatipestifer]MBT0574299.1 virulence protein [Riemerella anatipestifer]MCU7543472.1 virulence protein [Riemerella anatipestifer]